MCRKSLWCLMLLPWDSMRARRRLLTICWASSLDLRASRACSRTRREGRRIRAFRDEGVAHLEQGDLLLDGQGFRRNRHGIGQHEEDVGVLVQQGRGTRGRCARPPGRPGWNRRRARSPFRRKGTHPTPCGTSPPRRGPWSQSGFSGVRPRRCSMDSPGGRYARSVEFCESKLHSDEPLSHARDPAIYIHAACFAGSGC